METTTEAARAAKHNAQLIARLELAKTGRGYLTAYLGGERIHAATSTVKGWGGFLHPRALCQSHTPRSYASEYDPAGDTREVTCQRCLASMEKRRIL